jgi:hypothetical protein
MRDKNGVQEQVKRDPQQPSDDETESTDQVHRHGKFEIQIREIKAPVRPRGVLAE